MYYKKYIIPEELIESLETYFNKNYLSYDLIKEISTEKDAQDNFIKEEYIFYTYFDSEQMSHIVMSIVKDKTVVVIENDGICYIDVV